MVPAAFVLLDALPLTANGKVDRKALPRPDAAAARGEPPTSLRARRTRSARRRSGREVLGVDARRRRRQLLRLGGHSLLATQVVSRIRATFGVELPLRAVFEAPTVAGAGARVERGSPRAGVRPARRSPGAARTAPLPLSFAQQRLWFLDQLEPGSSAYNIPGAVRLQRRPRRRPRCQRALADVVARHEALRTTFAPR